MSGTLIWGAQGARHICEVASHLYEVMLTRYNQESGRLCRRYEPWMCSEPLRKIIDIDQFIEARTQKFWIDRNFLSYFANVIEQSGESVLFVEGEEKKIRIFSEIDEFYPDIKSFYQNSLELLQASSPWMCAVVNALVVSTVPIAGKLRDLRTGSLTSHLTLGTVYLSIQDPNSKFPILDNAISYAHEIGHHALYVYQYGNRLFTDAFENESYSGVQQTKRPILMSLHAAVALAYMALAARDLSMIQGMTEAEVEYLKSKQRSKSAALARTIEGLESFHFTAVGIRIFEDLKSAQRLCSSC